MADLGNDKFYKVVQKDFTEEFRIKLNDMIKDLAEKEEIPQDVPKLLLNEELCKTPQIYFLPKIHKGKLPPPGRPIASGNNCPSEKISTYVDIFLKPLVRKSASYVKDTGAFIEMIKEIDPLSDNDIIGNLDVTSLYTNIPNDKGITVISDTLNKMRTTSLPPQQQSIKLATRSSTEE